MAAQSILLNSLEAIGKQIGKQFPDALKMLDSTSAISKKALTSELKTNPELGTKISNALTSGNWKEFHALREQSQAKFNDNSITNRLSKQTNPTNTELFEEKQVEALLANSKLDPEDLQFEGYEMPDVNKVNEYKRAEALSHIRTNRGTGNYLHIPSLTDPEQVKRIRLDYKRLKTVEGFDNPIKQYSWKDAGVKAKENTKIPLKRGGYALATTTTKKNIGTPAVKKPAGTIWHHSIPSQSTGKIYEAYMRNINPKFKLTKNAPRNREFLRMLREVEKETGVRFGDDPLNARYLKGDPTHNILHVELRKHGIDPKQIEAGLTGVEMTPTEARKWLIKLAEASKAVDEAMNFDRLMLTP